MKKILFLLPFFLWTCSEGPTEPEPPQLPTVTNIEVTTLEDTAKTFALTGTDPNNLALTYSISTQPQHGTISISGGAATYSPNANYHGQDVIAYLASSTNGNSNIGTIIITVTPVDDEPNTMDVTATTDEDISVQITLEAEDVDGDNIEFQIRNNPSNGSVNISGTTATYTPNQDWFGTDTFNFEAVDSSSRSIINVATATITVNPINDAPTVQNISDLNVANTQSIEIKLSGYDVDGDNLTFEIVQAPSNGNYSISNDVLTYNAYSSGSSDSFTFRANDGKEVSNLGTVEINLFFINYYSGGPNNGYSRGKEIIQEDGGGFIIAGYESNGNTGERKLRLIATDNNGARLWDKVYDDAEFGDSIIQANDGGFIVVGQENGYTSSSRKAFIMKTDNFGNSEWTKIIGWIGNEVPANGRLYKIKRTLDNNFIAVGSVDNPSNVLIIKFDNQGEQIWASKISGSNYTTIYDIAELTDGGFILVGEIQSGVWSDSEPTIWISKIDNIGNIEWEQQKGDGIAYSVENTSDGGFLFSGYRAYSESSEDHYPLIIKCDNQGTNEYEVEFENPGRFYSSHNTLNSGYIFGGSKFTSEADMLIIKTDNQGNKIWEKNYSGHNSRNDSDFIYGVEVINDNFVFTGSSDGRTFFLKTDYQGNRIY
tara:strand:- start:95 stop:2056 length:1962 start_codon:yes stop_codon:yes gene_type:complete